MSIALPSSLAGDQDRAVQLLHAYYGQPFSRPGTRSGAAFDLWDSTGTREQDVDVFTADDLVAVSLLAVQVPGPAARVLLVEKRQDFSELLALVGPDRDLASVRQPFDDAGPEWALQRALTDLEGSTRPRPASSTPASARGFGRSTTPSSAQCWAPSCGTGSPSGRLCSRRPPATCTRN